MRQIDLDRLPARIGLEAEAFWRVAGAAPDPLGRRVV
jgi:hypothetical protein